MLKSYANECYAAIAANNKRYVEAGSPESDEPNSSSNLNSSMDESSQHSQSLSIASSSATPLGIITNKINNTNYAHTADSTATATTAYPGYSMYPGYHHSMIPTSTPSPSTSSFTQAQYSLGSLADSCAAAAAAAHWTNGRMNPQFYSNQTNSMTAAPSMNTSSNQMLGHRLSHSHHNNHRNSIGSSSSSSSAESSSTSIVDENSPVGTGFHHASMPRYANQVSGSVSQAPQYPYNMDTASSQVQTAPTTPLINAAAILNRMSRPVEAVTNQATAAAGSGSLPIKKRRPVPVEHKDSGYWEKRRKNNESAKKSRDTKREKEHHMALRISYLERENFELKTRCACLMQENEKLTNMLIAAQNGSAQIPSSN